MKSAKNNTHNSISEIPTPSGIYQGRFAPAPTGPLHLGSLLTAVGSFLEARHQQGCWRVRIEDVDTSRVVSGASDGILRSLDRLGLHWDGTIIYQSQRQTAYQNILTALQARARVFPCACTRKRTKGKPYDGRCRAGLPEGESARAWRVQVPSDTISFVDGLQGEFSQALDEVVGDFIVKRGDGLFAYQLAVVVDDAAQGITHIVRGVDLLDSTPRQIYLQQLLNYPTPAYLHLPIIVNAEGHKLSKQNHAPAVDCENPIPLLYQILTWLAEFWQWAIAHWQVDRVPKVTHLYADS